MEKEALISVRNLTARFDQKLVLDGIDLDVYEREVTVIIGGSGSGKTTLLKNMLRLHRPSAGSVRFWNRETTQMSDEEFDKILVNVGMLFQNGALINSIPVAENIAIPLEQHTDLPPEIIQKMIDVKLHLVNLHHAKQLLPSELSGGMKKRAALARAIALDPQILFCDEPSAGLDPLMTAALDELILKLREQLNMTIVIVTHELASIHRVADRVIFLGEGKVLFSGSLADAQECRIPAVHTFFEIGRF